jgi:hypothetical protein
VADTDFLWGDNFYDTEAELWTKRRTKSAPERGFVKFVYKPLRSVIEACVNNDVPNLESWVTRLHLLNLQARGLGDDESKGAHQGLHAGLGACRRRAPQDDRTVPAAWSVSTTAPSTTPTPRP